MLLFKFLFCRFLLDDFLFIPRYTSLDILFEYFGTIYPNFSLSGVVGRKATADMEVGTLVAYLRDDNISPEEAALR